MTPAGGGLGAVGQKSCCQPNITNCTALASVVPVLAPVPVIVVFGLTS